MSILSDDDRENLSAYLDGELDEEASHALEAKINLDPEARAEVEALKQAWGMLDYLPRPQPSTGFTHRTLEKLSLVQMGKALETGRMPAPGSGLLRYIAWAAAFLAMTGAGLGASFLLWHQPRDQGAEEPLVRHLRVLEKWRQYEHIDDLDFLKSMDHPDMFGDEPGS